METTGNRTALGVSADVAQLVGTRLRKARENTGRSTAVLSSKIKVREHYIVAIEEGLWNELPPGLNGRGLIRIYARELSVAVPELDQGANQSVMPAEHDAQAPYQLSPKKDSSFDRDSVSVRSSSDPQTTTHRGPGAVATVSQNFASPVSGGRNKRANDAHSSPEPRRHASTTPTKRLMDSTPEEAPLDVVTPDVASILGINLEGLEDIRQFAPMKEAARTETADIRMTQAASVPTPQTDPQQPVVEPPALRGASTSSVSEQSLEPAASSPRQSAFATIEKDEVPLVLPEGHVGDFSKKHDVVPSLVESSQKTGEAKLDNELAAVAVSAPEAPETQVPESAGVSAAQDYLRLQNASSEISGEGSEAVEKSKSPLRWAVGLSAACVAALVIGQLLLRTPEPPATTVETEVPAEQNSATQTESMNDATTDAMKTGELPASASVPVPAVTSEASAEITEPAKQPTTVQSIAAPEPAASSSATAATASPVATKAPMVGNTAATVASPSSTTATPVTAAASTSEGEGAETEESPTPVRNSASTGARAAVLTLSDAIDVQVTADGKRVYSGKQNAGKIEIKFNRNAEIIVQDGSKVKLKYAGWDHGALGQAGRKRRIVLHADAFASPTGEN